MRLLPLILFLLLYNDGSSQIIAVITDTAHVGFYEFPDSTYYIRNCPPEASYTIYYDEAKTKIAVSRTYISKNRFDTKNWYRNGRPKKFELNNDSIPYYNKDVIEWFPDGHLERQLTTTRDSTILFSWWSNHQLQTVHKSWGGAWKHNCGHRMFWHASGLICEQNWWYTDSSVTHNYHDNGAISWIRIFHKDSLVKNKSLCYSDQTFHPNGAVARSIVYPGKGRQPCTYYYPSGIKQGACNWMEGNIGAYQEWYESGQIKCEGNYSMGTLYFPHVDITNYYPTKTGHWIYYNKDGWIEREEWRGFDGIVTIKKFNAEGEVISEYQIQERIAEGVIFSEKYRQ